MNLLWTDVFFLSLLFCLTTMILLSLKKMPARRVFRRLFQQPLSICAGIVLMFFLIIALLDSIHFKAVAKNTTEVTRDTVSILDMILAPLGENYEKTYSAPLALHLFTKEITTINGQIKQVYPRLAYPPKSISSTQQKISLIRSMILNEFFRALISVLLVWLMIRIFFSPVSLNIGIALLTLFCCLFFMFASYKISRQFHLFGTGKIGQDIFYYTVKSIRTGLVIGVLTTLFMLPLALLLGIAAGFCGGWIDDVIQFVYTRRALTRSATFIYARMLYGKKIQTHHTQRSDVNSDSASARFQSCCNS